MTTFAVAADALLDETDDLDGFPRSVANPRRTTWTGFAKDDQDRLPPAETNLTLSRHVPVTGAA